MWERVKGARQEKREVDIYHPTCIITFHLPPLHKMPDRQNGWEKGGEMRRVNKEISTSASKNPLHLSRAQCFLNEGNLCVCVYTLSAALGNEIKHFTTRWVKRDKKVKKQFKFGDILWSKTAVALRNYSCQSYLLLTLHTPLK